jgi:transposase
MENYIAIDVGSEVSSACVMTSSGRVRLETNIITRASDLRLLVKSVKRPRTVVLEECCQAAWLYALLEPLCDDVFICDPRQNSHLSGDKKSDRSDAYHLAERARGKLLERVWHGGERFQDLREALRLYQTLTRNSTAIKNQIKAVFRSRGIAIGNKAYKQQTRPEAIEQLPREAQKMRVALLGEALDVVAQRRKEAHKYLVRAARKNQMYRPLTTMDGIGEIYASMIVAEVGTPHRFRTRRQFWSYAGLAVTTHETSEYYVDKSGSIRKKRGQARTRGLTRNYNRTLKYVFKQVSRILANGEWKDAYDRLVHQGVTPNCARLTLARKAAAVALHLAKTGEDYDKTLVFAHK